MNIGVIHGFVGEGGADRILFSLLEGLKGHDVTIYTVSKPKIELPFRVVSSLPFYLPVFGLYQRLMEAKLPKKAKSHDVIVCTSGSPVFPEKDQKLILYCHHDFQDESKKKDTKYSGLWGIYYKPYQNLIEKFLKVIKSNNINLVSNSKFVHDSILEHFEKNSEVIYPPVEINKFQKKIQKDPKSVISISRYSPEKRLDVAIRIIQDIPDISFKIIGSTYTKSNIIYYNHIKEKTKNYSHIELLKDIQRNRLIEYVARSKVYLHTSEETFGISVVEAISAGCIPIVPDNSAHKETVPYTELRYDSVVDAQRKIKEAVSGEYDNLLSDLQEHIKQFDERNFQKKVMEYMKKITLQDEG